MLPGKKYVTLIQLSEKCDEYFFGNFEWREI